MRKIKKLTALMLAVVMVLAMSITAFASGDVPETGDGNTNEPPANSEAAVQQPAITSSAYKIYQIFTGDYANGVLSNVKWGEDGTGTLGTPVDDATLKELEAVFSNRDSAGNNYTINDQDQLAVITKYAKLDNPIKTGTETTYTGLTPGYYLVQGTVTYGTEADAQNVDTLYVVRVSDGTLTFTPKVGVPTVDKKIVENNNKVTANGESIGDEVKYEITGTLPSNYDSYKKYYYEFSDTLSKGLTFKEGTLKVWLGEAETGTDITNQFVTSVETKQDGTTAISVKCTDTKLITGLAANSQIKVTYTATLNEQAVIGGEGNPNNVKLIYSNNPNKSGEGEPGNPNNPIGETPESKVETYTTELTILKTDEDQKFLPGVEFTLTGSGVNIVLVTEETFEAADDGTYWKLTDGTYTTTEPTEDTADAYDSTTTKYKKATSVVAKGTGKTETEVVGTVGDNGTVTFQGLGAGEYTITETKTLPGYNTIDPITFTLTFDAGTKKFTSDNDKVTVGEDNKLDANIVNTKGSLLPSTGGIGTTIFYVVGAILVIGAGVILVVKKRMSNE